MSQDNISIEDRVRDILFDYGSTNKSVNLGEAKSLIMEEIRLARLDEHKIAIMKDANYTQAEWDLMEKIGGFYPGNLKRLEQLQKGGSEHKPHKRNGEE